MPIYTYRCQAEHIFEEIEPMASPLTRNCIKPKCQRRARRIMSRANVNVDAVMQPGDVKYTPPMSHYLGRRRWSKKQDAARERARESKNPVTI